MSIIGVRAIDGLDSVNYTPTPGTGCIASEFMGNAMEVLLAAGWKAYAAGEGTGGAFTVAPNNPRNRNGAGTYKTGTGDSLALSSGTTWTLTDSGATFASTDVGRYIQIRGAANAGNNGFFLVTAFVSATVIRITNASGVAETSSFTWTLSSCNNGGNWTVLGEPALFSGTGAWTIALVSGSTYSLTVTGGGFRAIDVGKQITLSGFANAGNNGSFPITARTSANVIEFTNASSVAETGPATAYYDIHRREWLFHRNTANDNWRWYYSALDHFTGAGFGAISATVPPSAADQNQRRGTSNNYTSIAPTDGTYNAHCVASNAAEGEAYYFFFGATLRADADVQYVSFQDPMEVGSYPANTATSAAPNGDEDPVVIFTGFNTGVPNADVSAGSSTQGVNCWYKYNMAGETFVVMSGGYWDAASGTSRYFPGTSGTTGPGPEPYTGKELFGEIPYCRTTTTYPTQSGMKGVGKFVRWKGSNTNWPGHDDMGTSNARAYFDDVSVAWPTGKTPRYS